ncbi:hypothetical protein ACFC18_48650, partial [Streptomyces sp. NPDC056121]|uniref:hypothetical protein n=1 Tax=Streptomyces sp. NPDC056121 TaxID=3345718 RepID=UPI0035DBDC0E
TALEELNCPRHSPKRHFFRLSCHPGRELHPVVKGAVAPLSAPAGNGYLPDSTPVATGTNNTNQG